MVKNRNILLNCREIRQIDELSKIIYKCKEKNVGKMGEVVYNEIIIRRNMKSYGQYN